MRRDLGTTEGATAYAIENADARGLPHVLCTSHELFSILTGFPNVMRMTDGTEVLVRLASPDEFVAINHAAIAGLPEGARPEPVTRERAAELVAPIRLPGGAL